MADNGLLAAAESYTTAGLCALPANVASKRPRGLWKAWQNQRPPAERLPELMTGADAVCLVCGPVSGNLELLDFDCQAEAYPAWQAAITKQAPGLLERLVIERSQSGGRHVIYRHDAPPEGNQKLASKAIAAPAGPLTYKGKTYSPPTGETGPWTAKPCTIETRGQGGIFLCAPSPRYILEQGRLEEVTTITATERETLLATAKALNELPPESPKPAALPADDPKLPPCPPRATPNVAPPANDLRPGDDFNARGDLPAALVAAGWTLDHADDKQQYWRRPGKAVDWSATFNGDCFYVHSSNAQPLEAGKGYSRFNALAFLCYAGDHAAAGRALYQQGFGSPGQRQHQPDMPATESSTPALSTTPDAKPAKKKREPPALKPGQDRLFVNDPDACAFVYLTRKATTPAGTTLHHHGEQWRAWNGRHYETLADADLKARLRRWTARQQLLAGEKIVKPNIHTTNEIIAAMQAQANVPSTVEMPVMLDGRPINPEKIIAFSNGLLDIETGVLTEHTPQWFSANSLDYPYDPAATCPHWLDFIGTVADTEEDWLDALQMWFGLNLVADTTQQKMMLFVGPPRSGKGTVCRVLQHVLGKHNYCNPALGSLSESFGMECLIGKLAAIVPDAHIGRGSDSTRIMESLKSVIGEDHQTIRPIYKAAVNVRLLCRFTISVNELVVFPDASGAMASRLIILPFRHSHTGHEDLTIGRRLHAEASGIANWAIEGLTKLRQAGRLTQPQAGQQVLADYARLSSPVRGFILDFCVYPTNASVPCDELRAAWGIWCEENGHEAGSAGKFGERLYAACPNISRVLKGARGERERRYEGIDLTENARSLYNERRYRGNLPNTT